MKHTILIITTLGILFSSLTKAQQITDSIHTVGTNNSNTTTIVSTEYGGIMIPGLWVEFSYEKLSRQHFLKNDEGVIVGIALNPMNHYSFYSPSKKNSENIARFFKWEYDYRVREGFKALKIKENRKDNYIVWKFTENSIDNILLFGVKNKMFTNFLVYTDKWNEQKKIDFLEKTNLLNME